MASACSSPGRCNENASGTITSISPRGYLWHDDRRGALSCLLTARKVAPQQTRYHPMVRETLHALARAETRATGSLRELANWVGIHDD
jgi:hypothetical protein